MKTNLPIYELKINDSLSDDSEVSYISLVDSPAIQKDFIAFNEIQFVAPLKGEHQTEFLPRCIKYVVDEGKDSSQAVAICNSLWEQHFATNKISFDFDDTLSTAKGQALAIKLIKEGNTLYIISARHTVSGMFDVADKVGIPHSRIYATGSNQDKIAKIKELGITKHYDNNADVISQLGSVGIKFLYEHQFSIVNEEQKIISGPIMLADELIYRNNPEYGEHYVKFTAETIKSIAIKFAKKKYQNHINLMHDSNQVIPNITMFESFLTDKNRGILPMVGFENVADGSWFGSFYVENQNVWNGIKNGEYKGFSVEGLFEMIDTNNVSTANDMSDDNEVLNILNEINQIINKNKK